MPHTPLALLSRADQERLRGLRVMKGVALGALILMAILFVIGFALQGSYPGFGYLRAAAEGGMVGALADWFAVTALFRRPLGLPIPHTAIIPTRKDEIGRSLGEFVETNFLDGAVVRARLSQVAIARRAGEWLREETNAEHLTREGATIATAVLTALSDDDVRDLISDLARQHLVDPDWGTPSGEWLERIVESGAHRGAVDLAINTISSWLDNNGDVFRGLISRRLPTWVPSIAHRFVDDAAYNEAVKFVRAVQTDPNHQARRALDGYLRRLAHELQYDPATRAKLDEAKHNLFDNPRVGALAGDVWRAAKAGLITALANPQSGLRRRTTSALQEVGSRLVTEETLQRRVDGWVTDSAVFLVDRYRHDIASIISETVARWDPDETTQKIELMVGRDLQYIRLNGTVVGALAGLSIFSLAHALIPGV